MKTTLNQLKGFRFANTSRWNSYDQIGVDKAESAFENEDQAASETEAPAILDIAQVPKTTQSVDNQVLMDVTDMLELEGMSPVDGYDEIYRHYATTFGRTPDAFMQKVVEETKQRLLMWFFSHRETIRAALVLQESTARTSTTPTTQTMQTTSAAQQVIDDITRSNDRAASPHQHQGSDMTVADQCGQSDAFPIRSRSLVGSDDL